MRWPQTKINNIQKNILFSIIKLRESTECCMIEGKLYTI